jgi:putative transposase
VKTRKTYKFRIYPNKPELKNLTRTLTLCRELYNSALDERRTAYRIWKSIYTGTAVTRFDDGTLVALEYVTGEGTPPPPHISYYTQADQLPAIKEARPEFREVHSQVLQNVLKRVDLAFAAFFRRVKLGQTPGYPRFKGAGSFDSFTFPQLGWSLRNDKLTLSKIGTFKVKLHREVLGKVNTCTIKREGKDKWFVCFSVETSVEIPLNPEGPSVGIDMGLEHFANLSNGEQVDNPRFFRKAQKKLAKAQRRWDKVKHLNKGNPLRAGPGKVVRAAHRKVKNSRSDFQHKLSKNLVQTYSVIAVENLNVKGLAGGMLAKSVNDAGWGQFLQYLNYKAVNAGSRVVEVDARYTSQICPNCGAIAKKELSVRWHSCPCGCELHRDTAAALVILSRGLSTLRNQSVEATPL